MRALSLAAVATWAGAAWLLGLSILSLGNGELWLDEILGLSFMSMDWSELTFLFTAGNAHFPTWFYLMKLVSYLLPAQTLSPTIYTRGAGVVLYAGVLLFTAGTIASMRSRSAASWFFVLVTIILADAHWTTFSVEGKQQGLMLVAAACAVLLVIVEKYRAAAYVSLIPALMHPFGMMASLSIVPALILLEWLSRYLSQGREKSLVPRDVITAFSLFCIYLGLLLYIKFIAATANDYSLIYSAQSEYGEGISGLLKSLPWFMLKASLASMVVLISLKLLYRKLLNKSHGRLIPDMTRDFLLAAFVVWVIVMAGMMAIAKPSTPNRIHYVAWLAPSIMLVLVFSVVQLFDLGFRLCQQWLPASRRLTLGNRFTRLAANVPLVVCLGAAAYVGSHRSFGFGESGLLGAAQAIHAIKDDDVGIFGTNLQEIRLPDAYRRGLKCPGATLVTMYLSQRSRDKVLCQGPEWVVKPPPSLKRVLFVEESGAFKYRRSIDLTGFQKIQEIAFGERAGTRLSVYERIPAE